MTLKLSRSKNDYGQSEEELSAMVDEQSEILESIFAEIDNLQDKNDDLQKQRADINVEITRINRENELSMRTTKKLKRERQSQSAAPINVKLLGEEHRQFIAEKEDRVKELDEQLNKIQKKYETQENDLNLLINENSQLELENTRIEQEFEKLYTETKSIAQASTIKKAKISQQKAEISNLNKRISAAQDSIRDLITQTEENEVKGAIIPILRREIETLNSDNENYSQQIASVNYKIETIVEESKEEQERIQNEKSKKEELIGWKDEQASLREEYSTVLEEEKKVADELNRTMKHNAMLRKRLAKLEPIHKKWYPQFRGKNISENPEGSIASLLKELDEKDKKGADKGASSQNELKEIVAENQKLEQTILKRREGLDSALVRFKAQEANMKEKISSLRSAAFEKEHKLIEEIKSLQIKIAMKNI